MPDVVGVRFKKAGKVYYFDPADIELELNEHVVVDTNGGSELGQVVFTARQLADSEITTPLKPVLRKADSTDIMRLQEMDTKEKEALTECGTLVKKLDLQMKLISAEYNLDGTRLTIYFGAEERVDFRELVRELAGRLKVRVELRQMGPRDEAKLIGGCGRCGRSLCCGSFLNEFSPVSIRMAKQQNLPLNPMKISGVCGRLMCCLVYENEQYRTMKAKLPKIGQPVKTANGAAIVVGTNPLKEAVTVELENNTRVELPLDEIEIQDKADNKRVKRTRG